MYQETIPDSSVEAVDYFIGWFERDGWSVVSRGRSTFTVRKARKHWLRSIRFIEDRKMFTVIPFYDYYEKVLNDTHTNRWWKLPWKRYE